MSLRYSVVCLLIANTLIPLGLLIFATGFFPHKPFLSGRATWQHDESYFNSTAPFKKVIFMLVDALRSDFIYSPHSEFKFTQGLIRSGAALPFIAHAPSPTITLPRIKTITTGSIPSFLDAILNFAESDTTSSLSHQDNWLTQLKEGGEGKLAMYGDDTWLKLFPNTFSRADGTSSFFVSDFTEVDVNVTRHVSTELNRDDWNGLVLHYLGLDHIGHKSGPKSPFMAGKQSEMDDIVKQVYEHIESKTHLDSTIFVLCGDHGMNDAGNHGGSSDGETSPALLFISPKIKAISSGFKSPIALPEGQFRYYKQVEQSDITPTLAGLLGFPIPKNSVGVFILDLLRFWTNDQRISLLWQNAKQIRHVVETTFPTYPSGSELYPVDCQNVESDTRMLNCMWFKAVDAITIEGRQTADVLSILSEFLFNAQQILSRAATKYETGRLYLGICLAMLTLVLAFAAYIALDPKLCPSLLWMMFIAVSYSIMMFSSSYVEEEHHFWYWIISGWIGWLNVSDRSFGRGGRPSKIFTTFCMLFAVRVIRKWNQTGQKHAGEPDISRDFLSAHYILLWLLVLATYIDIARRLSSSSLAIISREFSPTIFHALCIAALGFKTSFTNADAPELLAGTPGALKDIMGNISLVVQARMVFLGIFATMILGALLKPHQSSMGLATSYQEEVLSLGHNLLTLFLMTQSRVTNIPLFLVFQILLHLLYSLDLPVCTITLASLVLQYTSFFAFGGSNAISSIDLSNGYNGVASYNAVIVGVLTLCGNWAGPIWWVSATSLLLRRRVYQGCKDAYIQHLSLLTAFNALSNMAVMVACTLLRTHLFIWTVFSPKYLYALAWGIGQHLCINVVLFSLLSWLEIG